MFGSGSQIIKYGFASGRVRVLETKMVSLARIKRLIEAEKLDEVHRVLAETDYGPDLRLAETVDEVEAALDKHLGSAYRLLRESNIPAEMERYWRSRYDFLNLRVLLKSGFGQQITVALSLLGEVAVETAASLVADRSFTGLPPYLEAAAREAVTKYTADRKFEDIDIILDRHYFNNLLWLAGKLKSKWITTYTKLLIDLANGRIVVRIGQAATKIDVRDYLIDGGSIDISAWHELLRGAGIADQLAVFPPGDVKDQLVALAARGLPVADYDLAADNVAIDWLVTSHRFNVGPEPVFAYVAGREHEVKLLRLIICGHLSGLSPARLKERVSRIYE